MSDLATSPPARPRGTDSAAARVGGGALILAAVLFMAVFGYLAVRFDYPDVLDGPAADVLPRLLQLGDGGRAVWALYAMIPLLLIPAGTGAYAALRHRAPAMMHAAALLAVVSALAMLLGLMRWPTTHWALAHGMAAAASDAERAVIATLFDGLNLYLGNYLGEFVGELAMNLFFLLAAMATRGDTRFPRWTATAGAVAALLGLVALWRNVTPLVVRVAEIENYVLPLWMIVFGILLARLRASRLDAAH